MVRIAIIDDGICTEEYNILPIVENIVVDEDGKVFRAMSTDTVNDIKGWHGTICAAIISKHCKDAELINIIMSADHVDNTISAMSLYSALELCLSLNVDIINISAGIIDIAYYYDFLNIINRLYKNNIYIVAASSIDERITIPASYSNVIGVLYSETVEMNGYRIDNSLLCAANFLVNNI